MSNDVYNADLLTKEEKFWLDQLSTDLEMSSFVNFNKKVGVKNQEEKIFTYRLSENISHKISEISNHSEYGMFIILIASVKYLLSIYTDSKDISIGVASNSIKIWHSIL